MGSNRPDMGAHWSRGVNVYVKDKGVEEDGAVMFCHDERDKKALWHHRHS